ncbi:hypothetical protein GOP47_0000762 [Adiantum capillus-veneris]|uniref:RING-type domain-containing protein n=1 Tax=Adiantum capillus-veneris TaxID=13818 RepID=A0A9D4ZR07_ADICA|nr:hypothetical protein GOP47_0000762 [Adiantum capillus-veneris]
MAGAALSLQKEDEDRSYPTITDECQDVLARLVSLEPRELCSESIVEKCRATRDLRSCGRTVEHSLTSCNHASLCAECAQRCDVCPICRASIGRHGPLMRRRLYEECCEVGLINSRTEDARERDEHPNADVQRLWSFFDVALEYKLVSVICHYVSDVCMDERAVSNNATVSLLLDGTVVKDWCQRTLLRIIWSLSDIYCLGTTQMRSKVGDMERFSTGLLGLSHVLESLEGPDLDSSSAQLLELQQLIEGTQRVSQHLDVMCWCARHNFLEDIQSSHSSLNDWRLAVKERKLSATNRVRSGHARNAVLEMTPHSSTLFIEDAMSNIGFGKDNESPYLWESLELQCLRQAAPSLPFRRREGVPGGQSNVRVPTALYPPESARAAVDMIFLEASSDLFLAKKAIFLYYLFDRHWPNHNDGLKELVDDYILVFDISRHAMLESSVFFLLDEIDDSALEEACRLLPEVVSCNIHPKVARVLLERQKPFVALDVLRCSSGDGSLGLSEPLDKDELPHLQDAVTAVRVRLECGLLTDAYLYQRLYVSRIKGRAFQGALPKSNRSNEEELRYWSHNMDCLVQEICWLCIQKNLVAKMIELPWDKNEEKILLNCLLEQAARDPCSSAGSLMVMFYIMRCRNQEAYLVHKRLSAIERTFLDQCSDKEKGEIIKSICAQRSILMEKGVELMPQIQQDQLTSGSLDQFLLPSTGNETAYEVSNSNSNFPDVQEELRLSTNPASTSVVNTNNSPVIPPMTSTELGLGNYRQPSILHGKPFRSTSGVPDVLSQLDVTILGSNTPQKGYSDGLLSPILGRKLLYNAENELTPFSNKNMRPVFTQDGKGKAQNEGLKFLRTPGLSSLDSKDKSDCLPSFEMPEPNLLEGNGRRPMNERGQNGASFGPENGMGTAIPLFRWSENGAVEKRESSRNGRLSDFPSGDVKYRSRRQMPNVSPNGKRKVYDQLDDHTPGDNMVVANNFKMPGIEQQKGLLPSGADIKNAYSRRKNGPRWRTEDDGTELPSVPVSSGRINNLNDCESWARVLVADIGSMYLLFCLPILAKERSEYRTYSGNFES